MEEEMLFEKDTRFFSWRASEKRCYEAEAELLELSGIEIKKKFVKVFGHNIHTLEMGSHFQEEEKQHLNRTMVVLPGFGAGVGFFYQNYKALGSVPGLKVYAVDWLGTGRSSRVPFSIKPGAEGSVEAAENFFVDSLEEWRRVMGIERLIVFGHSLGGYLSTCYTIKHPERVQHLFLVSPAGVPEKPPENPEVTRETQRSFFFSVVRYFWESSYTPQDFMRFLGPLGPSLVRRYVGARFPQISADEAQRLQEYGYQISVRRGSGEYGLHCILGFAAWARKPLIHRLPLVTCPTTFLYGSHDWMDPGAGRMAAAMMRKAKVYKISEAGHHLYLENPDEFNSVILSVLNKM